MNNIGSPPTKRMRLSGEDLTRISKDEIIELYMKQQNLLEELRGIPIVGGKESTKKCKLAESSRRENVLVMRLATKEQELQKYAAQISHIKKSQEDAAAKSLREAFLDPAVRLLFDKMREELKETKDKLEQAQSELSAWKFTPDSQTGKKLMSRCRTLIAENQELGRQLSQGKVAQLEAELSLQKSYTGQLKVNRDELDDFVVTLDEEVEGMQSTIQLLQRQLTDARKELEKYKKLATGADFNEKPRTTAERNPEELHLNTDRDLTSFKENKTGEVEQIFIKSEVGKNGVFEPSNGPGPPDERNFENSEFVCKEECETDGENSESENDGADENETIMEVDGDHLNKGNIEDRDREGTPTYSEHEIIDESQGSSLEQTPERESVKNEGDAVGVESLESFRAGSLGREENPMNNETYAIIDNGSDDEVEHVAKIVSTHDGIDNAMGVVDNDNEKTPRTPEGDFIEGLEMQESLDYDETNPEEDVNEQPLESVSNVIEGDILENMFPPSPAVELSTMTEVESSRLQEPEESVAEVERTTVAAEISTPVHTVPQLSTAETADIPAIENAPAEDTPAIQEQPKPKVEFQPFPLTGPQPTGLPTLAQSLMAPTQVSLMGDPAAYLMNPHFQHTALAQHQALMAEQASFMYKTMLAQQQQQQQLAMAEDKNYQLSDGSSMPKTVDELRTHMNPYGMPYVDPQAAFFAQYKAMLAAQSMFIPGPDGKTSQMIGPGGLGLYPGLPLIQPNIMTAQPNAEHGLNSIPSSWPTSTTMSYTPHSLMPQSFLGHNPAGMMLYPGHNLTPQPVTAPPTAVDTDTHHGSGDHGPIPNGLLTPKTQEHTDTNPPAEEPQRVT